MDRPAYLPRPAGLGRRRLRSYHMGAAMKAFICAHCGKESSRRNSDVNRAIRKNAPLFCGKVCFGLSRRQQKTKAERVEEKRLYDIQYREKNRKLLKAKKAAYFQRTYDPAQAAVKRKERMPRHVEYCRRPEYRAWKREYDRQYRALRDYGEFSDCFLLIQDIRAECLSQQSDYEIRFAKGRVAMTQQRKRNYARSIRKEPEIGPLGHIESRQGRQNGSLTS